MDKYVLKILYHDNDLGWYFEEVGKLLLGLMDVEQWKEVRETASLEEIRQLVCRSAYGFHVSREPMDMLRMCRLLKIDLQKLGKRGTLEYLLYKVEVVVGGEELIEEVRGEWLNGEALFVDFYRRNTWNQ